VRRKRLLTLLKTSDDPEVTNEGDQARQTKSPERRLVQTQDLAGDTETPKVEAKTNDFILNIRVVVNS
jgi:hypothetical protein